MITVEMTDDITKYDNKEYGPFTARQVKSFGIGLAYSVPIAIIVPVPILFKFVIFTFLFAPAIISSFVKMYDSYFEFIAVRMIYFFFLTPRKRKVVNKIELYEDIKAMEKDEERKKLSKMSSAQKKEYLKKHGKNKEMKYSNKKELKVYK